MKVLFCKCAWMDKYQGPAYENDDIIVGGGSYVDQTGEGGEQNNFIIHEDNRLRGYVYPKGYTDKYGEKKVQKINLERICKSAKNKEKVEGVLVVWAATHPDEEGSRVIGWYKNATVYREFTGDKYNDYYNVIADFRNCVLITNPNNRKVEIPKASKGVFGFGSALYRFTDEETSKEKVNEIIEYIEWYEENAYDPIWLP